MTLKYKDDRAGLAIRRHGGGYKPRASMANGVPPRLPLWDFSKNYRTGDGEGAMADRPGADDHACCPSWGNLT